MALFSRPPPRLSWEAPDWRAEEKKHRPPTVGPSGCDSGRLVSCHTWRSCLGSVHPAWDPAGDVLPHRPPRLPAVLGAAQGAAVRSSPGGRADPGVLPSLLSSSLNK